MDNDRDSGRLAHSANDQHGSEYDFNHNEFGDFARLNISSGWLWLDAALSKPEGANWRLSDDPPAPGSNRLIHVPATSKSMPAPGDEFWVQFMPAKAAVNGWEDAPDAIVATTFALCRATGGEWPWVEVSIDSVVPLVDVERTFPAILVERLGTWQISRRSLASYDDWELLIAYSEFAGWSLLGRCEGDQVHVVYGDQWQAFGPGDGHCAWAGHCILSAGEWRRLREEPPQLVSGP